MTTIKIKLRPTANGMGRLVYQLIHRRQVKRITSTILLTTSDWDYANHCPTIHCPKMQSDLEHLHRIIAQRDKQGREYTAADIADDFSKITSKIPFFTFVNNQINLKLQQGHKGTAKNYRSTLRQYQKFRKYIDISIDQIDSLEMQQFQSWLKDNGRCSNTISNYMRNLRCIYNRAVLQGLSVQRHPFTNVYTGIAKTTKRAISESDIKTIARLPLRHTPTLDTTRDLFMLSFYLMGMAFVDLAMLKKTNYAHGRIIYQRQKTGQTINILVCEKAKDIITKLSAPADSPYLLNIITDKDADSYLQYTKAMNSANRRLKTIAQLAALPCRLTTYTPRHTWASIAKAKNIELSIISDALGHESQTTTLIYLATIDTTSIDAAHQLIIHDI